MLNTEDLMTAYLKKLEDSNYGFTCWVCPFLSGSCDGVPLLKVITGVVASVNIVIKLCALYSIEYNKKK